MDLDEATDELYGLVPQQFIARRSELVATARAEGDRPLAAAIGRLRRPTVTAWAINLVAQDVADDLDALLALGDQLRSAQGAGDGPALRELSTQRHRQIDALTGQARRLAAEAGQRLTDSTLVEVQNTFTAAVADVAAGQAVRSGRLTTGLSYSGFGAVDLTDAVALPLTPTTGRRRHLVAVPSPGEEPESEAKPAVDADQRRRAAAEHTVAEAQQNAEDAADYAMRCATQLDEVQHRRAELAGRIESLRAELASTEVELRDAERALHIASRARDTARKQAARSADRLASARAALDRVSPGQDR